MVIHFAGGMVNWNVCHLTLFMTIKYCLIRTKAKLSHLEIRIRHHMSFLIVWLALGKVHLGVALLWVASLSPIVLQALGKVHLGIALLWVASLSPIVLQALSVMHLEVANPWVVLLFLIVFPALDLVHLRVAISPTDLKQELISRFGEKIFWVVF